MSIQNPFVDATMTDQTLTDGIEHTSDGAVARMPDVLDSPGSKLVYLYLNAVDRATVDELKAGLGMPTTRALSSA